MLAQLLVSIVISGIVSLGIAAFMTSFHRETLLSRAKLSSLELVGDIRSQLQRENQCLQVIGNTLSVPANLIDQPNTSDQRLALNRLNLGNSMILQPGQNLAPYQVRVEAIELSQIQSRGNDNDGRKLVSGEVLLRLSSAMRTPSSHTAVPQDAARTFREIRLSRLMFKLQNSTGGLVTDCFVESSHQGLLEESCRLQGGVPRRNRGTASITCDNNDGILRESCITLLGGTYDRENKKCTRSR